jgi:hypothetical protein
VGENMKQGYYIFFGVGDYHFSENMTKEWTCTWNLKDWKLFIEKLIVYDVDTVMIYLNGHSLPYNSLVFPFMVDSKHPNVKKEFLSELFEFVNKVGIKLIAVLTTTGHAGKYAEAHRDLQIEGVLPGKHKENRLLSFPEDMRMNKTLKKAGSAQLGYGVLCHNKILTRLFAENLIKEILCIYGCFFSGVALHPPESFAPCLCNQCSKLFFSENGYKIVDAPFKEQRKYFILSYLKYQNNSLFPIVRNILPGIGMYTFTIPWLFEDCAKEVLKFIDEEISIIEWDYNLSPERISSLVQRIDIYKSKGNKVWFMPSAGFSFNKNKDIDKQIQAVRTQVKVALNANVDGISYFIGPKMSDYFHETSFKRGG